MTQEAVGGESVEVLREALATLKHRTMNDGMVEVTGRLERELGEPLLRALLRLETELLDQDVAQGDPELRTTEQRRGDAFVLLVERLEALFERS